MKFIFIYSLEETNLISDFDPPPVSPEFEQIETGLDGCTLLSKETDNNYYFNDKGVIGFIQGYVRYPDCLHKESANSHNEKLFRQLLSEEFPLDKEVSNSFAALAIDVQAKKIAIANDLLGYYPLYYSVRGSKLVVSSHLLLISQLVECEIDTTGAVQRLTSPEYCNFGRRTLLKDVSRLLPGEYISFDLRLGFANLTKYDNSLFRGPFESNLDVAAKNVWKIVKDESMRCFNYDKELAIGLSGGMDSRILLASLPNGKKIDCYTYGDETYYETRIAKRCAETSGFSFRSLPEGTNLFPKRDRLRKYVLETEAVGFNQWISVLEHLKLDKMRKIPMALGEMTEAIAGRNIKVYSSRKARIKVFLGLMKVKWTPLNEERFNEWKNRNTRSILERIETDSRVSNLDFDKSKLETVDDLEDLYSRIHSHDIQYVELLDELFAWYVHSRLPSSNQLLLLRTNFHPICPTMSASCLRAVSLVHPSLRLNSHLMDRIFRIPDLKELSKIPTAQIPFLRYNRNNSLKLLAWGLRSRIDQVMIKIATRRNKVNSRNRLLTSINWAQVYSQVDPAVIASWFQPDFVGSERFTKIFDKRANQKAHPLIPHDIVSAAGLNMEIDFIKSTQESPADST